MNTYQSTKQQKTLFEEFTKYAGALKTLDMILGLFSTLLLVLYLIQVKLGVIDNKTLAWFFGFFLSNLAISQFSIRMKNPLWLEVFRIMPIGCISCFFTYLNGPWIFTWPIYLIMSLGCGIDLFLITGKSRWSYIQLAFWLSNLVLANWLKVDGMPLNLLLLIIGVIATTSILIIQIIGFLNASLTRELEIGTQMLQASKMSTLGEMASGVAHEINNPLAAVKILAGQMREVIEDDPLDKALVKKMAFDLEITTDRIAKIVQDLRAFSRDGSNDAFKEIQIAKLLNETLNLCNERFKSHGIELKCAKVSDELTVEGREVEISQVLLNLLNNAYDAIGSLTDRWIQISVKTEPDFIEIQIMDSGKGIPIEIRKKLFHPFFTTKEIGKSTGLGLSISVGLIRTHRGELFVDASSQNTCFVVRLPRHQKSVKQQQNAA